MSLPLCALASIASHPELAHSFSDPSHLSLVTIILSSHSSSLFIFAQHIINIRPSTRSIFHPLSLIRHPHFLSRASASATPFRTTPHRRLAALCLHYLNLSQPHLHLWLLPTSSHSSAVNTAASHISPLSAHHTLLLLHPTPSTRFRFTFTYLSPTSCCTHLCSRFRSVKRPCSGQLLRSIQLHWSRAILQDILTASQSAST